MRLSVDELIARINSFPDSDFGEPMPTPACSYKPKIVPPSVHPRMGFTAKKLEKLKKDFHHPENIYAKNSIIAASDMDFDGVPTDIDNQEVVNNVRIKSGEFNFIVLSKALRYALTGDKLYGYEAIYALKNLLKHCQDNYDVSYAHKYHISLSMAKLMQTTGFVYDWCYSLLSERDKRQIVSAATGKAPLGLEFPKFPPPPGGGICGHQSGPPYLQGWFPLTLAIYDEYPVYYEHIAELMFETIVPGQSYLVSGGAHPQGVAYGASRMQNMMFAECFFTNMFDEEIHMFSPKMGDAAFDFINCIRPDTENLRLGDDFMEGTRYSAVTTNALLGASLYKNPYLKHFAKNHLADFSIFHLNDITPIDIILYNDVDLEATEPDLPLVSYIPHPLGRMIVRTKKSGHDAGMVYMKIGEAYSTNHEHKDAGNFQIYYDGPLITNSGAYVGYGADFDCAYYKQTISKNCPLIFNPNMKDNGKWVYSGGQKIATPNLREPRTLEEWQESDNYRRAKVLCHSSKEENGQYRYACLGGDLTNAYDAETVTEVKRFFFNFMTGRPNQPMVHIIFDRITSVDPSYKKTILMHTLSRPLITERDGRTYAVINNLRRRLIVQSLLSDVDYTFVGDEDNRCPVNGKSYPMFLPGYPEGKKVRHNAEIGLGRIEISPRAERKTDLMLTVMYIDPDTDYSPYFMLNTSIMNPLNVAKEIVTDTVVGAVIMNKAVLFPKNGESLTEDTSVSFPTEENVDTCFVTGLACGKWKINGCEITVEDGTAEVSLQPDEKLTLHYLH